MRPSIAIITVALAVIAAFRPWIALFFILTLGLLGTLLPGLQDIRGLSIIAICGSAGMLRYLIKSTLRGSVLLWPLSFLALYTLNTVLLGSLPASFLYLLVGSICAYYLAIYSFRSEKQALIIAWAAIAIGVIASVMSLVDYDQATKAFSELDPLYAGRIHAVERSLVGNPNYLFPQVVVGLFFSVLFCYVHRSRAIRLLMLLATVLMISGIFATLSRGSVLAVATIFVVLVVARVEWLSFGWLKYSALIAMVVGAIYFVVPDAFSLFLDRFIQDDNPYAFGSRSQLAGIGIQDFFASPVWGVGLGSMISRLGVSPHDGYVALLGEMGILGFIAFYSYPLMLCVQVFRLRRRARGQAPGDEPHLPSPTYDVLLAFLTGILVYNFFNNIIYLKTVLMLFGLGHLLLAGGRGKQTIETRAWVEAIGGGRLSRTAWSLHPGPPFRRNSRVALRVTEKSHLGSCENPLFR